ncbi:MAG: hypothetical protein ACI91V_000849 [Lentimonas sp.]|jgi:hypothetical protein
MGFLMRGELASPGTTLFVFRQRESIEVRPIANARMRKLIVPTKYKRNKAKNDQSKRESVTESGEADKLFAPLAWAQRLPHHAIDNFPVDRNTQANESDYS